MAVRPAVIMSPARWCRRCTCAVPDAVHHGRVANVLIHSTMREMYSDACILHCVVRVYRCAWIRRHRLRKFAKISMCLTSIGLVLSQPVDDTETLRIGGCWPCRRFCIVRLFYRFVCCPCSAHFIGDNGSLSVPIEAVDVFRFSDLLLGIGL